MVTSETTTRWSRKIALVTGASSGIGAAIARVLAEADLRVILTGRRSPQLEDLAEEIGEGASKKVMDVADLRSIERTFAEVEEEYGGLDVLVNSAGLGYQQSLLTGDLERFREMFDVNVLGLCACTQQGVRLMRTRQEGHVFHLGSLSGHRIPFGSNVYGATKFAVRSLAESLRQELVSEGLPIRVSTVSPGFVETEFHAKYFESSDKSAELYGRYKVLEARDVADAVLYALQSPPHVAVHDILVRSRYQPS